MPYSDQRAQVDAEDEAVMNLIRSDDWVQSPTCMNLNYSSEKFVVLICTFKYAVLLR